MKLGDIMKVVKKVIISIILIIIAVCTVTVGYFVSEGHEMYKIAIETTSLEAKVAEIKSEPNYTKLEEIPKIYIDAVISVEDHRFKDHEGIDVISIGRAIFNDIKEMMLKKWPKAKYIGYFQARTNTYAPVDKLRELYETILRQENVIGLNIATRPDAITNECLDYLKELNKKRL